uniref:Poly(A) RNA polymerase cid14 n=1 Tax=Nicotiana tabacum TaxID=4097 RepID=A0A1S3ZRU1_TOBAC|nr:PREDICTED: poly(A) RNA polymerase cid14-like [Nicotiana tabacum]
MGSCGNGNRVEMENGWSFLSPDPLTVTEDCLAVAEEATEEVVNCVHPTLDTEEKRKAVIDYVQRLIKFSLGCEVFPYGSVPLKTYLPDGDIDLTVFSSSITEETFGRDVLAVLQEEEQKEVAEYDVKDPQFIDAEVKLVKCLVQNTVIDISFNQLGGLCTLCFLEQVDRLVGKNHLFKRSIILIKAWCYYESRILGAHHGLISTYALETLVLFIFHLFHSSLNGPLAVLYRFLDYYSKFDWDNYCISLNGPVCKSSPDILGRQCPSFHLCCCLQSLFDVYVLV